MKYFQIRVPADSCLEYVLQGISKDIWLLIKNSLIPDDYSGDVYRRLHESIKFSVSEHIQQYDNCGLAEECHDDIEGGPWVDYNDRIYLLSLSGDFDSYIQETSKKVLRSLDGFSGEGQPDLLAKLSQIVRKGLGKYLFYNPKCKRIPFCELQL